MASDHRQPFQLRQLNIKDLFSCLLGLFLLSGFGLRDAVGHNWEDDDATEETGTVVPIRFDADYRDVQWCVNGIDEPEFQRFPLNEFVPLLTRKHYVQHEANIRFKYDIDLLPIKLKANSGTGKIKKIGSGGNLFQRAHFVFKTKLREEFYHDISLRYRDAKIEGLIVQANFAQHGVGIPFGQFDHPKYFSCIDCKKPLGIPVACRRRTHMHIVHPTIMVFHHKMKPVKEHRERQFKDCDEPEVKKQCIVTGIKYLEENEPMPTENSTDTGGTGTGTEMMNGTGNATQLFWNRTVTTEFLNKPLFNNIDGTCGSPADCDEKVADWFENECCENNKAEDAVMSAICETKRSLWGLMQPALGENMPFPRECKTGDMSMTCNPAAWTMAPKYEPPLKPCPNSIMDMDLQLHEPFDLILNPRPMSRDWPVFECKAHIVTVCRPPGTDKRSDKPAEYLKDHPTNMPYPTAAPDMPHPPAPPGVDRFDPLNLDTQCCLGAPPGSAPCEAMDPSTGILQPTKPCQKANPMLKPPILETECVQRFLQPIEWKLGDTANFKFKKGAKPADCSEFLPPKKGEPDEYGKTNETHANFAWYIPPCRTNPVKVKFEIMVVHSFQRGVYSVVEHEDIFLLKANPGKTLNPYIPTPVFTGFKHLCEEKVALAEYLYTRTSDKKYVIGFSRSYDKCVQNITGVKLSYLDQTCPGVPTFVPPKPKLVYQKPKRPKDKSKDKADIPRCDIKTYKEEVLKCSEACPLLPTTTPETIIVTEKGFFKRTAHGAINIITNFCIMPICSFIARFYKETYNNQSFKGQRTWYWMHLVGSGGSTILMYLGYFTKKLVVDQGIDLHLFWGEVYMFFLALSYVTAWMRHKRYWLNTIVQLLHSFGGYSSIVLAAVCIYYAEEDGEYISYQVKYIVYASVLSLVIFYIGMTVHICILDRRMGMKPRRWHFPSVESKFDDLPYPGAVVRKILLYVILGINLPLTLATMFI